MTDQLTTDLLREKILSGVTVRELHIIHLESAELFFLMCILTE